MRYQTGIERFLVTQIFSGKNDKERLSTVIGAADKPTLIASLLECDSLIKTQQLGDPEWGEHSYEGKDDKKGAAGKDGGGKTYWENVTKAEDNNLKLPSTARVHGNSMMGYALETIVDRHMEMNSKRPFRDTPRDGTHGGRQCRLPLTRSRRAEERRGQPTLRRGARPA